MRLMYEYTVKSYKSTGIKTGNPIIKKCAKHVNRHFEDGEALLLANKNKE